MNSLVFMKTASLVARIDRAILAKDWETRDAVQIAAAHAYAAEVLPAIMGGVWQVSARRLVITPDDADCRLPTTLLDHRVVYCQQEPRRGRPLTLDDNVVLLGQPYGAHDASGKPTRYAIDAAAELAEFDLGVWARSDLSFHSPTRTSVILASTALRGRTDAQSFGFVDLCINAQPSPRNTVKSFGLPQAVKLHSPHPRLSAERR